MLLVITSLPWSNALEVFWAISIFFLTDLECTTGNGDFEFEEEMMNKDDNINLIQLFRKVKISNWVSEDPFLKEISRKILGTVFEGNVYLIKLLFWNRKHYRRKKTKDIQWNSRRRDKPRKFGEEKCMKTLEK